MTPYDSAHICFLVVVIGFLALSTWAVSKMPKLYQSIMIILGAVLCSGLIFFTCGMGLSWENGVNWTNLARQMLQVCQFNMILMPLMLVPKFELARQYSVMFSMFAAMTTFVSIPDFMASYKWYESRVLIFWAFHMLAIAVPLWIMAARRLKPQKKYVLPVVICVFAYFTVVYIISELLMDAGLMTVETSHSFIYKSGHTFPLKQLYDLIGIPYFYLWPLIPALYGFDYVLSWLFRNYKNKSFYLFPNRSVSFDGAGGSGKIFKRYAAIGYDVKLPHGGFIREGFALVGWSDTPDGKIRYAPGESMTVGKENITLYAIWEQLPEDT